MIRDPFVFIRSFVTNFSLYKPIRYKLKYARSFSFDHAFVFRYSSSNLRILSIYKYLRSEKLNILRHSIFPELTFFSIPSNQIFPILRFALFITKKFLIFASDF